MSPTQLAALAKSGALLIKFACNCDLDDARSEPGGLRCDNCGRKVKVQVRKVEDDNGCCNS